MSAHAPRRFSFNAVPKTIGVPLSRVHRRLTRVPASGPMILFYTINLHNCLSLHVLVKYNCHGIHGLVNNCGACSATATPLPSLSTPTNNNSSSSSMRTTASSIPTSTSISGGRALGVGTYNLRYPKPVVRIGGTVSDVTINRHIRVITASTNFTHSTST